MRIVVDNTEIDVDLEHYDDWKEEWLRAHGMSYESPLYTHAVSKQIDREYVESVKEMGRGYYQVICENYSQKYAL